MKLLVSLSSLLLALCLGSGAAGPLQGPWTGAGQGMGEAIGNGVEKAIGEGAKEAVSSGIEEAVGQGNGGEASSAFREARGDAPSNKLGEAAHALENTGREAGRQAENFIGRGTDAAHKSASWGTSGGHGVFGSHSSTVGQGNFGGPESPWGHGQPGGSEGSFGTNSLGGSAGQGDNGRIVNLETNAQGSASQPGYGSVRSSSQNSGCANGPLSGSGGSSTNSRESSSQSGGSSGNQGGSSGSQGGSSGGHSGSSSGSSHGIETSRDFDRPFSVSKESNSDSSSGSRGTSGGRNKPECDYPQNEGRITGESESEEGKQSSLLGSHSNSQGHTSSGDSKGDEGINELNSVNSQTSPGVFNFDNFWKNFKSKLGFINWDALNKEERSFRNP